MDTFSCNFYLLLQYSSVLNLPDFCVIYMFIKTPRLIKVLSVLTKKLEFVAVGVLQSLTKVAVLPVIRSGFY